MGTESDELSAPEAADPTGAPPTNFQRLSAHLTKDGLAAALLAAWESNKPAARQAALLKAIEDYHKPQEPLDEQSAAE